MNVRRSLYYAVPLLVTAFIYCNKYLFLVEGRWVFAAADDVLISATYAKTFAEGHGLVWFEGAPRVQGFTNMLWTLLLAAFSRLPFFAREHVGLYLLATNLVLLCGLLRLFETLLEENIHLPAARRLGALLMMLAVPLFHWLAAGFEIGALAIIGGLYFRSVQKAGRWKQGVMRGVLFGAALWIRMDSAVFLLPMEAYGVSRHRRLLSPVLGLAIGGFLGLLLLACQWSYYGDPLPNTYYLKSTGWPWGPNRLYWAAHGIHSIVPLLGFLGLPLLLWRRWPHREALWIISPYLALVAYTFYVGGDALGLRFGQNRFTATGLPFLFLSLAYGAQPFLGGNARSMRRAMAYCLCVALLLPSIAATPFTLRQSLTSLIPRHPAQKGPHELGYWVRAGMVFRDVAPAGAQLAVTGAGASIYFSGKGGVDLLGKSDPLIARMQVNAPAAGPGHNKRDEVLSFQQRRPAVSLVVPPTGPGIPVYHEVVIRNVVFYVRDGVRLIERHTNQ